MTLLILYSIFIIFTQVHLYNFLTYSLSFFNYNSTNRQEVGGT